MAKKLEDRINWGRLRHKYIRSNKKNRSKLLDELCDLTGMNRKYLIRKLGQKSRKTLKRRGPKPTYPPEIFNPIISKIWLTSDQPCSKKLVAMIPYWLPFYEREYGVLDADIKNKILSLSAATIDRLLKPLRVGGRRHGLSGTKPGTLIRNQIPIKTNQWEEERIGFMEADTVAHCGTSLEGDFIWSLTMTDILTGWTENRAVWNKGATDVGEKIDDIEASIPFNLRGFDCDNGSEFLNYHLLDKFTNRPKNKSISFTRSRPYKKNDNAHVEQKNWTHVRQLLGYHRLDKPILTKLINDLYKNEWSLYQNHFIPNMKCIEKTKVNSKYKKKFDAPQTPYERVMACDEITSAKKKKLKAQHEKLNPFELKRDIEKKLKKIFKHVRLNKKPRAKY